jgi:predicted RNA-binding protein with RPS1 domain
MKLLEFFTHTADGFEQDKTYDDENDISVLDKDDTRKTRLSLKDINSMRLASESHDAQQKEEAEFVQKMYGQPVGTEELEL